MITLIVNSSFDLTVVVVFESLKPVFGNKIKSNLVELSSTEVI